MLKGLGRYLVTPAVFLVLWQLVAVTLDSSVFPSPLESLQDVVTIFQSERFRINLSVTVGSLVAGFVIASVAGVIIGGLLGLSKFWMAGIGPLLYSLNSVPKVVIFPIFLLIIGLNSSSRIAFGAFNGFFAIALILMEASATLNPVYVKLARTYGLSRWQVLRHLIIPALTPHLVTGLRVGFGLVFLGVVLAELISAPSGLGNEIMQSVAIVNMPRVVAVVIVAFAIALLPTWIMRFMEVRIRARYQV